MTAATAITLARALYPLTGVSDAVLTAWYDWALALAGLYAFGDRQEQAVAHLLGHAGESWALSGGAAGTAGGGVGGVVTSSRSSTLALTFGAWAGSGAWTPGNATDALLMQTPGGRAFLALRATREAVTIPEVC